MVADSTCVYYFQPDLILEVISFNHGFCGSYAKELVSKAQNMTSPGKLFSLWMDRAGRVLHVSLSVLSHFSFIFRKLHSLVTDPCSCKVEVHRCEKSCNG